MAIHHVSCVISSLQGADFTLELLHFANPPPPPSLSPCIFILHTRAEILICADVTVSIFLAHTSYPLFKFRAKTSILKLIAKSFDVFKYHVSCPDGTISVRIKIRITFIFRFLRRPIPLIVLVPVGLSSLFWHLRQGLLVVEISSVTRPGQLTCLNH